jgi:hypothetical protein
MQLAGSTNQQRYPVTAPFHHEAARYSLNFWDGDLDPHIKASDLQVNFL